MSALSPAALVQHVFAEIWNRGHLPLIDELFAPDYRGWVFPDLPSARIEPRAPQTVSDPRAHRRARLADQYPLPVRSGRGDHHPLARGGHPPRAVSWAASARAAGARVGHEYHAAHGAGQISEQWDHWNRRALLGQLATAPALATAVGSGRTPSRRRAGKRQRAGCARAAASRAPCPRNGAEVAFGWR